MVFHHWIISMGILHGQLASRDGVEVAGWTVNRETQVRFPAYPHRLWALWCDSKEVKDVFRRPSARAGVGLARLRLLAAHGVGFSAAGIKLETGQLSLRYLGEITLKLYMHVFYDQYITVIELDHVLQTYNSPYLTWPKCHALPLPSHQDFHMAPSSEVTYSFRSSSLSMYTASSIMI